MKRILHRETVKYIGKKVKVCGWVQTIREHGKVIFIDLRDSTGLLQIVFTRNSESKTQTGSQNSQIFTQAQKLRPEWTIKVIGKVKRRPKNMVNPNIVTGKIELVAQTLKILNKSKTLPFDILGDTRKIDEELRLKYRYLDLRSERLQKNLILRHKVIKFIRDFMSARDFIEIETPLLTKSTPEGARDFVVPSRLHPAKFYALPQSPQQYKMLLMAAGIERYFQIARCLRDEDPRADRQFEHTQLDIEMAFVERKEEIMQIVEELIIKLVEKFKPLTGKKLLKKPLPRLTYKEALEKYGTDKPDLRKNKEPDILAFAWIVDWPLFTWSKEEKRWDPMHHLFTKPREADEKKLDTEPGKVLSTQFDLVCNGYELGSGSLRINQRKMQEKIFELIGLGVKKGREQFQHLLEAFDYGCPTLGGMAPGIDRLVMLLAGEPNIREVITFPKTGDGRELMMGTPAPITEKQLKELHIRVVKPDKNLKSP